MTHHQKENRKRSIPAPLRAVISPAAAVVLTIVLTITALAGAAVAGAHAALISSDPAADTVLTEAPLRVSATFNEPMQREFAAMAVIGPDDKTWSTGDAQVQDSVVSIALRTLGPAGTYTVNYRATSADGHVVSGSWSFRLAAPGTGAPGPAAPPPAAPAAAGDSPPVWPFALAAVVIVGGGVWWAMRRRL